MDTLKSPTHSHNSYHGRGNQEVQEILNDQEIIQNEKGQTLTIKFVETNTKKHIEIYGHKAKLINKYKETAWDMNNAIQIMKTYNGMQRHMVKYTKI